MALSRNLVPCAAGKVLSRTRAPVGPPSAGAGLLVDPSQTGIAAHGRPFASSSCGRLRLSLFAPSFDR
jgi:hypothetical protein